MEELVRENVSSLGYTIMKEQLDVVVVLPFTYQVCFAYLPGAFNRLLYIKEDDSSLLCLC